MSYRNTHAGLNSTEKGEYRLVACVTRHFFLCRPRPKPQSCLLAPPSDATAVFCLLLERSRVLTNILAAARRGALVVLAGVLVAREMVDDITGFDGGKCVKYELREK